MIRLPDPFTPGAAAANAATPTCCCCCCCCAISSVGALVALPAGLRHDTRDQPRSRWPLVLPAAIFPLLTLALPFVLDTTNVLPYVLIGLVLAAIWAGLAGFLAGSPKPWASLVRLAVWCTLFVAEFFLALFLVLPLAAAGGWVVAGLYLAAAGFTGYRVCRTYR